MYYGSKEFNSIVDTPNGQALKLRLTFSDNKKIELVKSLKFYGGSNASNDISIGTTLSAYVDVSLFEDSNLTNQEFLLEQGAMLENGEMEYAPIGYFTVQRPDSEDDIATFTAYDRMKRFDKPYTSSLKYPTTSDKVLEELCTICGVELAATIENPITITDNLQGYICREVLGYIAGIQGCFACIDRFGKLNVRWYENEPITKDLRLIYSMDKAQDDYVVEKVEIHKDAETSYMSGAGTRTIYQSNPYATQEIANSIFDGIGGFSYRPCEVKMLDDIRYDPWDVVRIVDIEGLECLIPCMQIEHDFNKGTTRIEAVGATETENEYRYEGPIIQYLNRMAVELLTVNKIVANVVTTDYLEANYVATNQLDAVKAEIEEAVIGSVSADFADIRFANIDVANIDKTNIGLLFAEVGLIDRATIVDGHITGFLDAVKINANSITTGTLTTDRLVIRGSEKSIVYELNNIDGALQAVDVDTLNGEIITPRTINADKIIAESITANELDVANIFGNSAVLNTITSQEIFSNAIATNKVVVGASNSANTALSTANNASSNAKTALSTANSAKTTADNAISTANTASLNASTALSTANTTSATLAQWCSDKDKTLIDGGKIYTGSITAKQINVSDLFAQDITATGTIQGAKLTGALGIFTEYFEVSVPAVAYPDRTEFYIYNSTNGVSMGLRSNADDAQFPEANLVFEEGIVSLSAYHTMILRSEGSVSIDTGNGDLNVTGDVITSSGASLNTIDSTLNNCGISKYLASKLPVGVTNTITVSNLNNYKYILARISTSGGAVPVIVPTELALFDKLEYANSFHSTSGNLISVSVKALSATQLQVWSSCTGYTAYYVDVFGVY